MGIAVNQVTVRLPNGTEITAAANVPGEPDGSNPWLADSETHQK